MFIFNSKEIKSYQLTLNSEKMKKVIEKKGFKQLFLTLKIKLFLKKFLEIRLVNEHVPVKVFFWKKKESNSKRKFFKLLQVNKKNSVLKEKVLNILKNIVYYKNYIWDFLSQKLEKELTFMHLKLNYEQTILGNFFKQFYFILYNRLFRKKIWFNFSQLNIVKYSKKMGSQNFKTPNQHFEKKKGSIVLDKKALYQTLSSRFSNKNLGVKKIFSLNLIKGRNFFKLQQILKSNLRIKKKLFNLATKF